MKLFLEKKFPPIYNLIHKGLGKEISLYIEMCAKHFETSFQLIIIYS